MFASLLASRATSLNAKADAVAMAVAAFLTLLLSHFSAPLAPLRLLVLAAAAFAAWSFCDEMGMRKPLNRAEFIFFAIALGTGAFLGLGALLSATEGSAPADLGFVTLIEQIFGLWVYCAAWLLWRGHIRWPVFAP